VAVRSLAGRAFGPFEYRVADSPHYCSLPPVTIPSTNLWHTVSVNDAYPGVSYVMPVLNEADHLRRAVTTVLAQDFPGEQEIILALGPSTDDSNTIAHQLAASDARVKLVYNPERDIPIGLNLA